MSSKEILKINMSKNLDDQCLSHVTIRNCLVEYKKKIDRCRKNIDFVQDFLEDLETK